MATLESALRFAEEWSLPIFPCGPDKAPLTAHGFKDATCNNPQIEEWWTTWPCALIGYPTGKASGYLVIDVDPDGHAWFHQHLDKLAPGVVVKTQRGFHLLYRNPSDHDIRCSTSQVSRGVDVRGNGGYAIMWAAEGLAMTGDLVDVTNVPDALLDRLLNPAAPAAKKVNGMGIHEGARNSALTSLGGKMRRADANVDELRVALQVFNSTRCHPPLAAGEVERIAESVANYSAGGTPAPPLLGVNFGDIKPHLSDSYVIKNLLARDSVAAIIGASSSGKTFLAGDLAVHIARGAPWRGHRVRGGLVVYVALEGKRSAENRLYAIRDAQKLGNLPLKLTAGPLNLRQPDSVTRVLDLVRAGEQEFGVPCAAVFIDTLNRAMAGGDENHAEDMAALVAGADALRLATGAVIPLVHHLGKDETRGARGHSLLRAAIDTELTVSVQNGVHLVKVTKQRDYALGGAYAFKLAQVSVGTDADGDPVTTCLVSIEDQLPVVELGGSNQKALQAGLHEWRREHPGEQFIAFDELAKVALGQGIGPKRRPEVLPVFINSGRLIPCAGGFRFG